MAGEQRIFGYVVDEAGNVGAAVGEAKGGGGLISLQFDVRSIARLGELLKRAAVEAPQAVAFALTETAQQTRTAMSRALVKQTGLAYGEVRADLSVSNAVPGFLSATITATGPFVPLGKFRASQTKRGASASPWNKRRVFPGTFIIARYGGNVYKRVGRARFPLHKLYGPAVPREFPKDESAAAFWATVPGVLAARLNHDLSRLLVAGAA